MVKKIVLTLFIMAAATSMVSAQEAGGLQSGNWGIAVTDVFGMIAFVMLFCWIKHRIHGLKDMCLSRIVLP